MPPPLNANTIVSAAPVRPFSGTVWRVHWRQVAPIDWSLSIRTSGRYHRGLDLFPASDAFPALYTSLAPEIALWEMVRRSAARNVSFLQNNVLTELRVDLTRVLDLSDPMTVGLSPTDLTGADRTLCQAIAASAIVHGCHGLLAPSAALPGANLIIFPTLLPETLPIRVVRQTDLPLDMIAQP